MKNFDKLIHSGKTVFHYADIALLLGIDNHNTLKWFTKRAVQQNLLRKIADGIYGFPQYNTLELAAGIRKKSYISLESVLQREGIIFQNYENTITVVSDDTREREIDGKKIQFFTIKDSILLNPLGIEYNGRYLIASKERAICDRIYLSGEQYFDNLQSIDWKKLQIISTIYNKTTTLHIQNFIKDASNR